jgi:hypothetical protein
MSPSLVVIPSFRVARSANHRAKILVLNPRQHCVILVKLFHCSFVVPLAIVVGYGSHDNSVVDTSFLNKKIRSSYLYSRSRFFLSSSDSNVVVLRRSGNYPKKELHQECSYKVVHIGSGRPV